MKILKYSYICMFAATAGIMTACAPDGQEGMFPGKGEPVTVKFSIDTRAAGTDDFDSQVKTLRVYAFQDGSPVGYYYGGEDVSAHTLNGSCRREKSGFMQWPTNRRPEVCFAKTREIFLCCPVRLPEAYIRLRGWK